MWVTGTKLASCHFSGTYNVQVAPRFVKNNSGSLLLATELADTVVGSAKFSALFVLANLRNIHYRYYVVFSDGTREIMKS